jgi:hypothetical protein
MTTHKELVAKAEKLNAMALELLDMDSHFYTREDHIHAAQGLMSAYTQMVSMQLSIALENGENITSEGSLAFIRQAAELHLRAAEVLGNA